MNNFKPLIGRTRDLTSKVVTILGTLLPMHNKHMRLDGRLIIAVELYNIIRSSILLLKKSLRSLFHSEEIKIKYIRFWCENIKQIRIIRIIFHDFQSWKCLIMFSHCILINERSLKNQATPYDRYACTI